MNKAKPTPVLIVEASGTSCALPLEQLRKRGDEYTVAQVGTLAAAKPLLGTYADGVVFIDGVLPDGNATDLLSDDAAVGTAPVILMAPDDSLSAAIAGIKAGATDCLVKADISPDGVLKVIEKSLRERANMAEQKAVEEQFRQTTKMQAIGELAGGIAHDFNNLLGGILGEANMLTFEYPPDSAAHKAAKSIELAATRGADLTRQLMGFARRGKYRVEPVSLHATIQEVVSLLGRTIPKSIRITLDLGADHATVQGDPSQMEQVMLNLAINARDAMPKGGVLTFRTDVTDLDEKQCQAHPGSSPGQYLEIMVEDNGHGMERETLSRVFEPFFTTKEPGSGTGMGLATVYGIVKNHGGFVLVDSEPEEGTTFSILLPLSQDAAEEKQEKTEEPRQVRQAGRVLLVDDEEMLRNVVSRMLAKLKYQVVTASNGKEAVDYYAKSGDDVDLVILDMMMPVMDGRDCFRGLKEMDPDVKVLLSTGSAFEGQSQALMGEGVLGFVQKPYRMNELADKIKEILEP
ncbi:MAG: response regulator [Lentisphaerae bacterium]|jgi:two-component system, cell cycle sensor histidine kinase and response regulator CckA|nr:response regulator [Lentisphaerota bacterium]MBT4823086.1 response regulator [Lentisphaerota bacterium]MBT5604920.1 response regulator [Lentisphaerota bacterium]MBT7056611.1 response regulator [Lentisphaerota bacterium]